MRRPLGDKAKGLRRSEPRRSPRVREVSRRTPTRDTPYYYYPPLHLLSSETHNMGFLPPPRLLSFIILGWEKKSNALYGRSRADFDGRRGVA